MSTVLRSGPASATASAAGPVNDFARAMQALTPERSLGQPRLREAATLVERGQFGPAATILQEFLKAHPEDTSALYLAAEVAARQGRYAEAEPVLARCVELAPEFNAARFHYANAMLETGKPDGAFRP